MGGDPRHAALQVQHADWQDMQSGDHDGCGLMAVA